MTTGTTNADLVPPKKRHSRLWLASLLLHAIALAVLLPWLRTEMVFDRQEEITRTREIKQREARRQAEAAARRENTRLTEADAQTLKREEERKRESALAERAKTLEEMARDMERRAGEKLKQVARRSEEDLVKMRTRRIRDQVEVARGVANQLRPSNPESKEKTGEIQNKLKELQEKISDIQENPEAYREQAAELADIARDISQTAMEALPLDPENHFHRTHLVRTAESLREVAEQADTLADGLNMAEENHTDFADAGGHEGARDDPPGPAGDYAQAVDHEARMQAAHNQARAAEMALDRGMSLTDAKNAVAGHTPRRPDLSAELANPNLETVADLDRHRANLDRALVETQHMVQRGHNMTGRGQPGSASPSSSSRAGGSEQAGGLAERTLAMQSLARGTGTYGQVIDFRGFTGGSEGGMGGQQGLDMGAGSGDLLDLQGSYIRDPRDPSLMADVKRVNPDAFGRDTLPGRKFTDDSERRGWMFVDTWYLIGPWENQGNLRHDISRPPEDFVDLDATYTDGKFANVTGHPDELLKWEFYQSDQVRCQPLRVYNNATYFAYTELYSDRDREVLITISTDDAAKAWLNDTLIWEDRGGTPWRVGEGFRRVILRKGYNSLLVRIENGPIFCVWSVVLMPTDG